MKNSKILRRPYLLTGLVVVAAIVGMLLIPSDNGSADQMSSPAAITQNSHAPNEAAETFSGNALPTLAKMVGALFLVIVCIYFGVYLLKKTVGAKYGCGNRLNALEVLETAGIGPKQSVTLVRVGEKSVLLGITGEHISMLTELNSEETKAVFATVPDETEPDAFSRMLSNAAAQMRKLTVKKKQTALEA